MAVGGKRLRQKGTFLVGGIGTPPYRSAVDFKAASPLSKCEPIRRSELTKIVITLSMNTFSPSSVQVTRVPFPCGSIVKILMLRAANGLTQSACKRIRFCEDSRISNRPFPALPFPLHSQMAPLPEAEPL